jgi:DNA-binding response OmpR family regulator
MRILFVEDNQGLADAFAALATHLGHVPDVAYDGHTALSLASTTLYDAIFLDIGLPDIDGRALCLRLRTASENAQTCVVAITGRTNLSASEIAPFDGYLLKPVTRETLEAVINNC